LSSSGNEAIIPPVSEARRSSVTIEGLTPLEFLSPRDVRLAKFTTNTADEMGLSPLAREKLLSYADCLLRAGEIKEARGTAIRHEYHSEDGSLIGVSMTHPEDANTHISMLETSGEVIHERHLSSSLNSREAAKEVKEYLVVFFG